MRESRRSDCPISSALDLLGDRWSLLVMRDVLLGGTRMPQCPPCWSLG